MTYTQNTLLVEPRVDTPALASLPHHPLSYAVSYCNDQTVGTQSSIRRIFNRVKQILFGMAVLGVVSPRVVQAQDAGSVFTSLIADQLNKALGKVLSHKMNVTPTLVTVNPATQAATIELSNPGTDTMEATFSLGLRGPRSLFAGSGNDKTNKARGEQILAEPSSAPPSSGEDSDTIVSTASLAAWVKGLPEEVKLAPGEKKTITLTLDVPKSAKPGEYAAWLIVMTKAAKPSEDEPGLVPNMKFSDDSFKHIESGAKIVYKIDPAK